MPVFMKFWLVPVWVILGISRALVLTVPFRYVAPQLGSACGLETRVALATPAQEHRALQIGRTVRLVARYTPWKSNCFAQAIAARVLLGLYQIPFSLFFGIKRASAADQRLEAHVWTTTGRVSVTGGHGFDRFSVVQSFTK
jgi:hypothetical protein